MHALILHDVDPLGDNLRVVFFALFERVEIHISTVDERFEIVAQGAIPSRHQSRHQERGQPKLEPKVPPPPIIVFKYL